MKYFFLCSLAMILGCHPTNDAVPVSYWVKPGTFIGTWTIKNVSTPCTAIISKADSILIGNITNDSTKEILNLTGFHVNGIDDNPLHEYSVFDRSSFVGDTDNVNVFYFSDDAKNDGNILNYFGYRLNEPVVTSLTIVCTRK